MLSRKMDIESDTSSLNLKDNPGTIQTLHLKSSPKVDYPPQTDFVDCIKSLFDIFDAEEKGYVTIDELEKHLNDTADLTPVNSNTKNLTLIHALQQVCPANGCINFKRFDLAIQIALGKCNTGKEKGISRALRPMSYLFAVTEARNNETGVKQGSRIMLPKIISSSPADSTISSDMDERSESNDSIDAPEKDPYQLKREKKSKMKKLESEKGKKAIEEFFLLQKCLLETKKVKEIYQARISELEEAIEEDRHIAISSSFDYTHAALHISKILRMNEKLAFLQLPGPTYLTTEDIGSYLKPQKKIEELNFCINQLENEKSVLVKDYFSLKARFTELEGKQEENILF